MTDEVTRNSKLAFRNLCRKHSLSLDDSQLELLENYNSLLLSWNKKINLVSRQDENNFWERHITGSISFLFKFELHEPASMLDLGTGGGLPGIPLAVILPTISFTLVDSIQKKINAVNDILGRLRLRNVSIVCGRAEDLGAQPAFSGKFDYVISRAVAPVKDLIRWSKPFLRLQSETSGIERPKDKGRSLVPRGSILMLKGGDLTKEMAAAAEQFKPRTVFAFTLPQENPAEPIDKKLIIVQP